MERGDIIDRLIAVKKTSEIGLGLPPRPRGLDDAGARRAPRAASCRSTRSRASGASSSRPSPMCRPRSRSMPTSRAATRRCATSARFHFGFTVPYRPHQSAAAVIDAVAAARRRPRHLPPRPGRLGRRLVARPRRRQAARRSSPACPSSSARTTPPARRSSSSRSPSPTPPCATSCSMPPSFERWRGGASQRSPALGGEVIASAGDARGLSVLLAAPGSARRARGRSADGARRRRPRRDRQPCRAFPREIVTKLG